MIDSGEFVEIHNWYSRKLVYVTHGIVKLEKYKIFKEENSLNLGS